MGKRTGKEPGVQDSFLWRICHAIDETPRLLAQNIDVPYDDILPLLAYMPNQLGDIDMDEVWWKIDAYVAKKLGNLLAIKHELAKTLQTTRKQRIVRTERLKAYHAE